MRGGNPVAGPAPLRQGGCNPALVLNCRRFDPEPSRDFTSQEDTCAGLTGACFGAYLCLIEGFGPFRKKNIFCCMAVSVPFTVLGARLGEESSRLQRVGQGLVGGAVKGS